VTKDEISGIGRDANPIDGDSVVFRVWIRDGKVAAGAEGIRTGMISQVGDVTTNVEFRTGAEARELGHETFGGCEVARRAALALGQLVYGRSADEVLAINARQVIDAIGGVPVENERCVLTVIGALRSAVIDAQVSALVQATYESRTMRVK
jgi:hypothetical protein